MSKDWISLFCLNKRKEKTLICDIFPFDYIMRAKCKMQTTDRLSQVCLVCIWKTSWMWHRVRTSGIIKFICFVLDGFVESLWHVVTVRLDYRKITTMKQLTDKETCRSVNNELNSVWCVQFVVRLWKEFPRGPFLAPCCFKIFSWTICTITSFK